VNAVGPRILYAGRAEGRQSNTVLSQTKRGKLLAYEEGKHVSNPVEYLPRSVAFIYWTQRKEKRKFAAASKYHTTKTYEVWPDS
jgi:hypothetical protein